MEGTKQSKCGKKLKLYILTRLASAQSFEFTPLIEYSISHDTNFAKEHIGCQAGLKVGVNFLGRS